MHRRFPIRPSFFLILIGIFLLFYYLITTYSTTTDKKTLDLESIKRLSQRIYNSNKNEDNFCLLPRLDPWDPEIEEVFPDLGLSPKQCNPSLTLMTSLKNGTLRTTWKRSLFSWFAPSCYFR